MTDKLTPEQVADLAAKGTQGPWKWQAEDECLVGPRQIVMTQDDEGRKSFAHYPDGTHMTNAQRIANVPAMEALIASQAAEIERLRDALASAGKSLDWWSDQLFNDVIHIRPSDHAAFMAGLNALNGDTND